MGRPRIEIEKKTFEGLCAIQCTLEEIAEVLGCSEDTVERWCKREYHTSFAEVYQKKSAKGKSSLRRIQWKLAEHNVAMAIFLGKQYLGQKDVVEKEFNPESLKKAKELLDGVDSVIE